MASKIILAIACLLAVAAAVPQTKVCSERHGLCMLERDCTHGLLPGYDGLCGKSANVICCSDPEPEYCFYGAGQCNVHCPSQVTVDSDECPHGEKCCVWL